jgi:hypothetical protein
MAQSQSLIDMIAGLSSEQQEAVKEFVEFLKAQPQQAHDFHSALETFMREHSELLRRLTQ